MWTPLLVFHLPEKQNKKPVAAVEKKTQKKSAFFFNS